MKAMINSDFEKGVHYVYVVVGSREIAYASSSESNGDAMTKVAQTLADKLANIFEEIVTPHND